jgi:hypothetical protein
VGESADDGSDVVTPTYVPVLPNGNDDVDEALARAGVAPPTVAEEPTFGGVGEAGPELVVAASELESLRVEVHTYSKSAKGTLAALAGLLGLDVNAAAVGLEHEAARYVLVPVDGNAATATQFYKVGCAARLFVVTTELKLRVQLTIPQLAAAAELGYTQGRITIEVQGYTGPFKSIPAPAGLSVEAFTEYTTTFREMQAAVFAEENVRYLRPRLLGVVSS